MKRMKKIISLLIAFVSIFSLFTYAAEEVASVFEDFTAQKAGTVPQGFHVISNGGEISIVNKGGNALKIERTTEIAKIKSEGLIVEKDLRIPNNMNFDFSFDLLANFNMDSALKLSFMSSDKSTVYSLDLSGDEFKKWTNVSLSYIPNEGAEIKIGENDPKTEAVDLKNISAIRFTIASGHTLESYIDNIKAIIGDEKDLSAKKHKITITKPDISNIQVSLNDLYLYFDQPPVMMMERVLVPVRKIFEEIGATVEWDSAAQTAIGEKDGTKITMKVGDNVAYINGEPKELDVSVQFINERVLVPVRFVSEAFGCLVKWDEKNRTVKITIQEERTSNIVNDDRPLPEGGELMLPKDHYLGMDYSKAHDYVVGLGTYANMAVIDVPAEENMPFKKAIRVDTYQTPARTYNVQIKPRGIGVWRKGDVGFARIYIKSISSDAEQGVAQTFFCAQMGADPYTNLSLGSRMVCQGEPGVWVRYDIPFVNDLDLKGEDVQVALSFGYKNQIIEVGGFEFYNYGKSVKVEDLPSMKYTYNGRDPDAQWRKDALSRIEEIRKGDFSVNVVDKAGEPVPNASVKVDMTKHEFKFGTAVANYRLFHSNQDGQRYRENLLKYFNTATAESAFKAPLLEDPVEREKAYREAQWYYDNNMEFRGHTLVWERKDMLPAAVYKAIENKDAEATVRLMKKFITDTAAPIKGKVAQWDVMNEPVGNPLIRDLAGWDTLVEWYTMMREIDPDAMLYVNDNRIEGLEPSRLEPFMEIVKYLIDHDAPLDGIGIQSHLGNGLDPEVALRKFDVLSQFGQDLMITEFDCSTDDVDLQADMSRDYLIAAFSHPKMVGFICWGFWDGQHVYNNAPFFNVDWSMKKSGQYMADLMTKEWWTNEAGLAGADGAYNLRGFYGNYDIEVTAGGKTYKKSTLFSTYDDDNIITVVID